jgi:hypothetical protein
MNQPLRLILFLTALFFSNCTTLPPTYTSAGTTALADKTKNVLVLPLDTLHVDYADNTKAIPDTLFSDSFFIEAANGLILYEASKHFSMCQSQLSDQDSISTLKIKGFSRLLADTAHIHDVELYMKKLALAHKADVIIVPYNCQIKHITWRPTGWRKDKYAGPGYERPISYTATTSCHIQIWDKNGTLLYERIGNSNTGRPILYAMLKNEKNPGKDIVAYAKRFYSPPLVKSLYSSIKSTLQVSY